MDENLLKQEKIAAAGMRRPWIYVAFIGLWPALLVLAMMQMHCVTFPSLHWLYPVVAILGGGAYLCIKVAGLWRNGGRMAMNGELKPVSTGFAVRNIIGLTFCVAVTAFLACYVLLGDLVLFTSRTPHDYDATVMGVWSGAKRKCKNEAGFVDETLQAGVNECAPDSDDIRAGVRVHVQTLTGPFGVRFLSVRRAPSE